MILADNYECTQTQQIRDRQGNAFSILGKDFSGIVRISDVDCASSAPQPIDLQSICPAYDFDHEAIIS